MGEMINSFTVLVGNDDWKRPRGRPRRRLKDNIRMDRTLTGFMWLRIRTGGGLL
jgi:hypothetical protein